MMMHAATFWAFLIVIVAGSCAAPAAPSKPASRPASQPSTQSDPQRLRWEQTILLFGDEASGEWSLRVRDQDVDRAHRFHYRRLWTYDRNRKQWVKLPVEPSDALMVPAREKPKDEFNHELNQTLVVLPIEKGKVGLFYATWEVDGVTGASWVKIGPGLEDRKLLPRGRPPKGKIVAVIPIDAQHAEADFIPDPRIACKEEDKGQ